LGLGGLWGGDIFLAKTQQNHPELLKFKVKHVNILKVRFFFQIANMNNNSFLLHRL